MTTNTTFCQPDITTAPVSRPRAGYSQMSGEKFALGTAARIHVATGTGADLRIVADVPGVPPRGVPV